MDWFFIGDLGTFATIVLVVLIIALIAFLLGGGSIFGSLSDLGQNCLEHEIKILIVVSIIVGIIALITSIILFRDADDENGQPRKPIYTYKFGLPVSAIMGALPTTHLTLLTLAEDTFGISEYFRNFYIGDIFTIWYKLPIAMFRSFGHFILITVVLLAGLLIPNIICGCLIVISPANLLDTTSENTAIRIIYKILFLICDIVAGGIGGGIYWGVLALFNHWLHFIG